MVEIWARRDEPETADLRRVIHAANALQDDPSSPVHLRAFAWRLVVDTHRAAGWSLPTDVSFASCRAAADSLFHACSLLTAEVAAQLRGADGPSLLLGGLADSQSVFGRWDLVPADGAVLVALDRREETYVDPADLPVTNGVHWVGAGASHQLYRQLTTTATLETSEVLVPRPELVAARVANAGLRPDDPAALVFCGAAFVTEDWDEVTRIAKGLGRAPALYEAAVALGLEQYLGVKAGGVQKWLRAVKRAARR